ncbi:MAG: glycosyltransferase family 33 protein [Rariglobus sp.]|jgi:beta-1,4-mannosyltransferase|nr:glycosyltransferase family 33 protein [Rariglobus sp.]
MLNHARALLGRGWRVSLAGYAENPLPPDLAGNPLAEVWDLSAGGAGRPRAWWRLARRLRNDGSWRLAIVQNPPGFPALWALPWRLRGREVVLDWHNVGASLYALSRPRATLRTKLYALCERMAARRATVTWAVSHALARRVAPSAVVVIDAPSSVFLASAKVPQDRLEWWRRVLPGQLPPPAKAAWIVAPSSWGTDEDNDAILRVARHWAARAAEWGEARPVVVIATGRGPGREAFASQAAALPEGPVSVRNVWLPPGEYPALLAAADAGLCLHRSSSGLDLPMKLADMRGAGLSALVLDYGPVLAETFVDGKNGRLFTDDAGLADCIREIVTRSPGDAVLGETWEHRWNRILGPWCATLEAKGSHS